MTTEIIPRVNLWDEENGYPTPGLNLTRFSLSFSKLPTLQLFANSINLPSITLGSASQPTPYLDMKQVGEKLVYSQFSVNFILDNKMDGYREIYQWMYDLSVQGLNTDNVSTCSLIFDSGEIEFLEVFPVSIGQIQFDSKATDINFASVDITFECDRYIIK